jgi:GNAT superfamily N-acetyltransferase
MTSLYAQYILEREGVSCLEFADGFITYKIEGPQCFVRDFFVQRSHRSLGVGHQLIDRVIEIAKEKGCSFIACSVVPTANGSHQSMRAILHPDYSFKLWYSEKNLIFFRKEL